MENLNKKQKIIFIGMAAVMCITIGIYFAGVWKMPEGEIIEERIEVAKEEQQEDKKKIIVHITGCVENEGIVELEEGARIADAIKKAGGETLDADISKINLAYKLKDGQKICVPSNIDDDNIEVVSQKADGVVTEDNKKDNPSKININTATQSELETLTRHRSINGIKNY